MVDVFVSRTDCQSEEKVKVKDSERCFSLKKRMHIKQGLKKYKTTES